ncbi:MAG: glycosyltransferase family 9 protein [Nitrospirae bacterium]|nr:glycosyltransferase family 9 protein [Nitrospirota bacterium]
MKEILIINLTRMGDLLQTTPLMAGLKEKHDGPKITLLVNAAFSEICKGIPYVDELIVFDMKDYRNRLKGDKYTLVENYNLLEGLLSRINSKEYDLTINVTHSPVSALLTSFVRTREVRGFTIDSEGHRLIKHPWMRYFFNVIPNRMYNAFHLVDMYLKIGAVKPGSKGLIYNVPPEEEVKASSVLIKEGVCEGDMLIGFHLGASKSDKTWPVSSYAELADMIARAFGAKILLFGSPGEADLADQFERNAGVKHINFVGKTNLGGLAALLRKCRLFISNDTGPLHIATSVGTKVIDISTANVHFMETGPYGEGHYVVQADLPCVPCGFDVQCTDMVCKTVIKPSAIFEVVKAAIEGKETSLMSNFAAWKNLQVYKSHFKGDGYLGFNPLIKHHLSKEALYRILYRQIWNMDSAPLNGRPDIYENICKEISAYHEFSHADGTILSIRKEIEALSNLVSLSEAGLNLVGLIGDEAVKDNLNAKKIKEIWKNVESVDSEIEVVGYTTPCIRPLTLIFMYAKEALEGSDLRTLSKAACMIYSDLKTRSGNMLQLMKQIIHLLEARSEGRTCELTTK